MKLFLFLFLLPGLCCAAIWPETFGEAKRQAVSAAAAAADELWREYGLRQTEKAVYDRFTAAAYRFQDSTGAMAASKQAGGQAIAYGNYLFIFEKYQPTTAELAALYEHLPKLEQSPLPSLLEYLPKDNRAPDSERYVTGPVALRRFLPGIPPSVAAFHLGAEATLATFLLSGKLAVFSYPTPQIAMQRVEEFRKIPGAVAKRTGPLVAVIVDPADPNEAQNLLAKVRYEAQISWAERMPTRRDNIGDLIVNVFILIGILLVFGLVAGLAFGGYRAARRKNDADAVITLDLRSPR